MEKLDGKTSDIVAGNKEKLRELFPEAFTEGKVDFTALKKALGESIDTENERYSMSWHGKSDAIKMALKQSTATLLPRKAESKDWDTTENLFIEGDNLEVLRVLQDSYRGKVKMIYIDPPYNTGHDFVYTDSFSDNIKNYKEKVCTAMQANADTSGRYHTNWLNMMYPRLRLARNLLRDDGVIFISIDDNEVTNLKKICDEIFGEENFVAQFVWEKMYTTKNDASTVSTCHEYVLLYCRTESKVRVKLLPRTAEMDARYTNPDNDERGVWKAIPMYAKGETRQGRFPIISPTGKEHLPPPDSHWRYPEVDVLKLISENKISFGQDGQSQPSLKRFLFEVQQGLTAKTLWPYEEVGSNDSAKKEIKDLFTSPPFDFPKPTTLIRRMIALSTDSDDIVLDFFSGSGTTAHAIMDLNAEDGGNRKWICVQIPEGTGDDSEACKAGYKTIADIGKERIRRAGEKIKKDYVEKLAERSTPLDTGFKVFALDETNFTQWDADTKDIQASLLEQLLPLKENRTDEDAVYEILLKYGIDPTTPIKELSFAGKKVFSLAGNYLLICLEKKIALDTIEEMAMLAPHRAVFYDNGFADDTVKANAEQTLKKAGVKEIMVI